MRMLAFFTLLSLSLNADELQVDPSGYFSIMIPTALLPCDLSPGNLRCPGTKTALSIQVSDVGENASVELMALNAEDALSMKPNFKMVQNETVSIDNNKVVVQTMTYNNLGNVTLPVMIRSMDSILGTKSFELQVGCNQSTCGALMGAFDAAIQSLHLAGKGQKLKQEAVSGNGLQNLFGNFKF